MLELYRSLADLALAEFGDIVKSLQMVGGSPADPNKLRLVFKDESFLDVWLSEDDDYAYHWEHRRKSGKIYHWDNAPHHPEVSTFPKHFHDGNEITVTLLTLENGATICIADIFTFKKAKT